MMKDFLLTIFLMLLMFWVMRVTFDLIELKHPTAKTVSILVTHHDGKYRVTDVWEEVSK